MIFYSGRGLPLVFWTDEPLKQPVLTVENTGKWYSLWLIGTDYSITEVDYPTLENCVELREESYCRDHIPNPNFVAEFAEQNDYYLCEQSLEMIVGRWTRDIDFWKQA